MPKFTDTMLAALTVPDGKKDVMVADTVQPGLMVRATANGAKIFFFSFRHAGKKDRVRIGAYGAITIADARRSAGKMAAIVADGRNPRREREKAAEEAKARDAVESFTLEMLIWEWEQGALLDKRTSYKKEAPRALRTALVKLLGTPVVTLTKTDVTRVLDDLRRRGRRSLADAVRRYGAAAFNWHFKRDRVSINPFAGLPTIKRPGSHDRVLSDEEVGLVWRAAGQLGQPFGPLFRLLLLTAARRDEVGEMTVDEINTTNKMWTVPAERSKNGKAHIIPLSQPARDEIERIGRTAASNLLFTTNGRTPVSGYSKAMRRLREEVERLRRQDAEREGRPTPAPVSHFQLHDFRRTVVTWAANAGFRAEVADKLLNHSTGKLGGVAGVYNRADFLPDRARLLDAWAAHVVRCADPEKHSDNEVPVIPFKRKK